MHTSRLAGVPVSGATVALRARASVDSKKATKRATSLRGPDAGPARYSRAAQRIPPTSAAAKANLSAAIDASLERTRAHLLGIQAADGSWNTPFIGGAMMMALSSLAMSGTGPDPRAGEVIDALRKAQNADGSFALNPGDVASPVATQLAALALERIAKRQPKLGASARAISAKARAYVARDPVNQNNLYGLTANILDDVLGDSDHVRGLPNLGMLGEIIRGYSNNTLSGLAQVFAAPVMLLFIEQAQAGSIFDVLMGTLASIGKDQLIERVIGDQDADGSWGWTAFGTALAVIALQPYTHNRKAQDAVQRGLDFIAGLRKGDMRSWTRGDAWDTGIAALTTQAIAPKADDASAAKAVKIALANQLDDGRFSFSLHGKLGDNDTSSTVLRMLCERYRNTTNAAEREQVGRAIGEAAIGLASYQQHVGSWGAFNKNVDAAQDPYLPPPNPSMSALHDTGSPDLTSRVVRSLCAARDSGALSPAKTKVVERALSRAKDFLVKVRDPKDGTWWDRWITGRIGTFAFVVPALRGLGLVADDPTFAKTRSFLLAHQNADGGWGESIEADRSPSAIGRGPSTAMQTAAAITALIGTCKDSEANDPALNKALQSGVAYLLKQEQDGSFSNGTQLYTILYGADYYDADTSTTSFVAGALRMYRDFVTMGPEKAVASSPL